MKIFAACIVILAGVLSVAAAHQAGIGPFVNSLPVTLPTPHGLTQSAGKTNVALTTGKWTDHWNIHFGAAPVSSRPNLRLQVELARNGAQATNSPSATGAVSSRRPSVTIRHMAQGSYQWWARFYNGTAIGPWAPFSAGAAFKIDDVRPSVPVITSSTDPIQGHVYKSGRVTFSWNSTDAGSGIVAYRTSFSNSHATNPRPVATKSAMLNFPGLATGTYLLTVRAQDRAGNLSRPATYRVTLDSTAPSISNYGFSTFAFNPHYTTMTFNYLVTQPATARIGIYRQSDDQLVRLVVRHSTQPSQLLHYTWRGRDNHNHIVPPGMYEFVVRTTDSYGNTHVSTYSNLQVLDKVIIVSVAQQKLWAYQDGHVVTSTLVTTGNVNCCATPPGLYTILAAYHPFTFISPEPKGSYYWYPDSPVEYALLFDPKGYYIHDAPWRTDYGPGTNLVPGPPGSPETGTHGCVNVPLAVEAFLYKWAPVGTPAKILG